ncbi:MAG: hypothetical protein LIP11_00180 [Clostridiales bacterium]|nr:hypothetical protein [Clostridiales bacterium]
MGEILSDSMFDSDRDLTIIKSKKKPEKERFSTPYTIMDLEYDSTDIAECLKRLKLEDYSETLIDKDDVNPPLLFVFVKYINHNQIYIKLKIKKIQKTHILCVSFHYAEGKMHFPYKSENE